MPPQPLSSRPPSDIAVIMAEIGGGGMGKMRLHLVNELALRGYRVDLVLGKNKSVYSIPVNDNVRIHRIGTSHPVFGVPRLALYLRVHRPRVLLTQRHRVNVLTWRARHLADIPARLFATSETHESNALAMLPEAKRRHRLHQIRRYLARNDGLIAISQGVAEDLAELTNWPTSAIHIVPNPIIQPDIDARAAEPVDHPWFNDPDIPIIVSAGRLSMEKNFGMLLSAFAQLVSSINARLVIFGEGPMRTELQQMVEKLGVAENTDMPGFVDNLYAYFARSNLFVLSSRFEGLSNVLIEAMAVGTPVISTDCPSGPAEVLDHGRLGTLVSVDDTNALTEAMSSILLSPPDTEKASRTARECYSITRSTSEYIHALGLD